MSCSKAVKVPYLKMNKKPLVLYLPAFLTILMETSFIYNVNSHSQRTYWHLKYL